MQHFKRESCKWLLSLFEDIDECLSLPCTHGTCYNSPGSYSCTCDSGWTGFNCDTGTSFTLQVSQMTRILNCMKFNRLKISQISKFHIIGQQLYKIYLVSNCSSICLQTLMNAWFNHLFVVMETVLIQQGHFLAVVRQAGPEVLAKKVSNEKIITIYILTNSISNILIFFLR